MTYKLIIASNIMKNYLRSFLVISLLSSCSVNEELNTEQKILYPIELSAQIENNSASINSKAYVDADLCILWDKDDRISLFNNYTYNKQYRFTGNTGANSGIFKEVSSEEVIVGNKLNNVYAVYPYKESTTISNNEVISIDLPNKQQYKQNSFGPGANTMISQTSNTDILFKNLCGYLVLKLYGDDISISSISLKGNNGELIAGAAEVIIDNKLPTLSFKKLEAFDTITLNCESPVKIGTNAEDATVFWIVVPPTNFINGFTLTITDSNGHSFIKESTTEKKITRNSTYRLKAFKVENNIKPQDQKIVFASKTIKKILVNAFDTDGDGELSLKEASEVSSIGTLLWGIDTEEYTFDEFRFFTSVKSLEKDAFARNEMKSIFLPNSLSVIEDNAFKNCKRRLTIFIPSSLRKIGRNAFWDSLYGCNVYIADLSAWCNIEFGHYVYGNPLSAGLIHTDTYGNIFIDGKLVTSLEIPKSVTSISPYSFMGSSIKELLLPESIENIGDHAFATTQLQSISFKRGLKSIEGQAFSSCKSLISIDLPSSVTSIGFMAFSFCSALTSITIRAETPPSGGHMMFGDPGNCPIYVPSKAVNAYKAAEYWRDYADQIQPI